MQHTRDTDPLLPITNMAGANEASKDGRKKRVLVVGAGAAGMLMNPPHSTNIFNIMH